MVAALSAYTVIWTSVAGHSMENVTALVSSPSLVGGQLVSVGQDRLTARVKFGSTSHTPLYQTMCMARSLRVPVTRMGSILV
jgi:hypothetical protein